MHTTALSESGIDRYNYQLTTQLKQSLRTPFFHTQDKEELKTWIMTFMTSLIRKVFSH